MYGFSIYGLNPFGFAIIVPANYNITLKRVPVLSTSAINIPINYTATRSGDEIEIDCVKPRDIGIISVYSPNS